jgi:hypothetical protein
VEQALAPAGALGLWTPAVAMALLAAAGLAYAWLKRRPAPVAGTWDCGYARPSARMQYTASSFAASILEQFNWILHPHIAKVRLTALFPGAANFCSHVGDVVLDGCLIPAWTATKGLMVDKRTRQQGSLQWSLIYICLTLFVLLLSLMPWGQLWNWMLVRG